MRSIAQFLDCLSQSVSYPWLSIVERHCLCMFWNSSSITAISGTKQTLCFIINFGIIFHTSRNYPPSSSPDACQLVCYFFSCFVIFIDLAFSNVAVVVFADSCTRPLELPSEEKFQMALNVHKDSSQSKELEAEVAELYKTGDGLPMELFSRASCLNCYSVFMFIS